MRRRVISASPSGLRASNTKRWRPAGRRRRFSCPRSQDRIDVAAVLQQQIIDSARWPAFRFPRENLPSDSLVEPTKAGVRAPLLVEDGPRGRLLQASKTAVATIRPRSEPDIDPHARSA